MRRRYSQLCKYAPKQALEALFDGIRRFSHHRSRIVDAGIHLGMDWSKTKLAPVQQHLVHVAGAHYGMLQLIATASGQGDHTEGGRQG